MGIALQKGPVHERAGVALVGVHDHVFDGIVRISGAFPFPAGREPGPAPAPDVGFFDLFEHFDIGHLSQGLGQSRVPA